MHALGRGDIFGDGAENSTSKRAVRQVQECHLEKGAAHYVVTVSMSASGCLFSKLGGGMPHAGAVLWVKGQQFLNVKRRQLTSGNATLG